MHRSSKKGQQVAKDSNRSAVTSKSAEEDRQYMMLAGQGDKVAFRKLVRKHMNQAVGFCEKMIGSNAEAEDLAQVAFSRVWQHAPTWKPDAKFTTWLYHILNNLCIDYHRKQVRRQNLMAADLIDESDMPSQPDSELLQSQIAQEVKDAIATLPERQRTAIVLSYFAQHSQKESAEIMQISEKAYESLLVRGRKQLRHTLGHLI